MRPDPTILAFDTSAAHCAAALLARGRIVAAAHEEMRRGQAERLVPMLEEVLDRAGLGWSDLDAVGVGTGPGNFTGIRIAVSTARGLALGLGVPAIGISGLEAQAFGTEGTVISTLAAPREALYLQVFGPEDPRGPVLTSLDELPPLPSARDPICIGAAAEAVAAHYGGAAADPACPLTEAIARMAALRADRAPERPAPLYLRAADAAPPSDPPPVILP